MLGKLRDPRQNATFKYLIYGIFGVLIFVFAVSFGPGSFGRQIDQPATTAASVNGDIITAVEFERQYGDYLERYRQFSGQPLSAEQAEAMGVRKQVLDGLIDRELVAKAAIDSGIRVSDSELKRKLMELDIFKVDGKFSPEHYKLVVNNYFRLPRAKFEARLRKEMLGEKMRLAVRESAKVLDNEILDAYKEENDKIDLEYIRFSPFQFKGSEKPTEAAIDEVLAKRRQEVEAFFERNKFRYSRPKRVKAQHVLIKVASDADTATKEAARSKAQTVLEEARGGSDFAELAKTYSQDEGSKEKGGDLGWFGPGSMVKPFEDAAFALEAGALSEVVESKFGYHVINVEAVQPAEEKALSEVEREVAGLVLEDELSKKGAKEQAQLVLAQAREGKTLSEIAPPTPAAKEGELPKKPAQFSASSTGLNALQGAYVSGIGRDAQLAAKVRELSQESPLLDEVVGLSGAFYVIRLKQRTLPDMKAFETEKEALKERLVTSRGRELEKAWVASLREKAELRINDAVLLAGNAGASASS